MAELAQTPEGQARIAAATQRLDRTTFDMIRAQSQGENVPEATSVPSEIPEVVVQSTDTPPTFLPLNVPEAIDVPNMDTSMGINGEDTVGTAMERATPVAGPPACVSESVWVRDGATSVDPPVGGMDVDAVVESCVVAGRHAKVIDVRGAGRAFDCRDLELSDVCVPVVWSRGTLRVEVSQTVRTGLVGWSLLVSLSWRVVKP